MIPLVPMISVALLRDVAPPTDRIKAQSFGPRSDSLHCGRAVNAVRHFWPNRHSVFSYNQPVMRALAAILTKYCVSGLGQPDLRETQDRFLSADVTNISSNLKRRLLLK